MRARRRFGQHFLEPVWAARVVDAIAPDAREAFVEIGPGRGALTLPLAARARLVVAVEIDRDLAADLARRSPSNVRVVSGDFLAVPADQLLPPDEPAVRIAGNLPYNVSSPIIGRLLELHRRDPRLADATLMLQREVAERLSAVPGTRAYGVLGVAVQRQAHVDALLDLPPGAFRPAPKVHSSLVRLRFRTGSDLITAPATFDPLVRGVFGQRRKRLSNALKPLADALGVAAPAVLTAAGLDSGRRPETLSVQEFVHLAEVLDRLRAPDAS